MKRILFFNLILCMYGKTHSSEHQKLSCENANEEYAVEYGAKTPYTPQEDDVDDSVMVEIQDGNSPSLHKQQLELHNSFLAASQSSGSQDKSFQTDSFLTVSEESLLNYLKQDVENSVQTILELKELNKSLMAKLRQLEIESSQANISYIHKIRLLEERISNIDQILNEQAHNLRHNSNSFDKFKKKLTTCCKSLKVKYLSKLKNLLADKKDPEDEI